MPYSTKITTNWQIKFKSWHFIFNGKSTILFMAIFSLLIYLGTWQLGRWQQKIVWHNLMQQRAENPPAQLSQIDSPELSKNRFLPVLEYGHYLNKYTFLLDNQFFQHQPGYRVLTASHSSNLNKLVLVDRGWLPRGKTRQDLPSVVPINTPQTITGIINTIPNGLTLGKHITETNKWPLVIQKLDYALISNILQQPIFNFVVQLQNADNADFRIFPTTFGAPSHKNFAYALQWYFFACLCLGFYLFTSIKKVADLAKS